MHQAPTVTRRTAAQAQVELARPLLFTLRTFVRWCETKRAISRLSGYPDSMLKDIGLTRGGIEWAVCNGRREIARPQRQAEEDSHDCKLNGYRQTTSGPASRALSQRAE